jgi:hypothetical protein
MFGHKDDEQNDSQVMQTTNDGAQTNDQPGVVLPSEEQANEIAEITTAVEGTHEVETMPPTDLPAPEVSNSTDTPEAASELSLADETPADDDVSVPVTVNSTPAAEPVESVESAESSGSDLSSLKQEALKELTPLVQHLDLPAEEKLNTIMKLYETTQDQSLLKAAFEAAKNISDDSLRAKSLFDLVQKLETLSA